MPFLPFCPSSPALSATSPTALHPCFPSATPSFSTVLPTISLLQLLPSSAALHQSSSPSQLASLPVFPCLNAASPAPSPSSDRFPALEPPLPPQCQRRRATSTAPRLRNPPALPLFLSTLALFFSPSTAPTQLTPPRLDPLAPPQHAPASPSSLARHRRHPRSTAAQAFPPPPLCPSFPPGAPPTLSLNPAGLWIPAVLAPASSTPVATSSSGCSRPRPASSARASPPGSLSTGPIQ